MPGLKLAVFDMDGTLIDSRKTIAAAMERAFVAEGLAAPDYDVARRVVGLSLDEALSRLCPPDFGRERAAALSRRYKEAFVAHRASADFHEPVYDGAQETLERLRKEGWLMALATGKSRRGVAACFETHGLAPYFDAVVCADDGPGKPHPFMIHEAMAATGAARAFTVMIGDSDHDIGMAKAANVHGLGVCWGFQTRDELIAAGAGAVCETFDELDGHLARFPEGAAA